MTISPLLGVAIMMNNYFHDVATALLAATAFAIHALVAVQEKRGDEASILFFLAAYDRMVGLFRFAFWWIIIGGIPRTIFYSSFEWANAAGKGQVPALVVKHILMFALVVGGVRAWRRLKVRVARLRAAVSGGEM